MNELLPMLLSNPEMMYYLRCNSHYVKLIDRNELMIPDFIDEYKVVMKKTWGDNVERIGQIATMAQMFM